MYSRGLYSLIAFELNTILNSQLQLLSGSLVCIHNKFQFHGLSPEFIRHFCPKTCTRCEFAICSCSMAQIVIPQSYMLLCPYV